MDNNENNLVPAPAPLSSDPEYKSSIPPSGASVNVPPIPPIAPTFQPTPPQIGAVPPSPNLPFAPAQASQPNVSPVTPPTIGVQVPQPKFESVERDIVAPIPSSPVPDIGIRTMTSDLSSLKSSGGLEAKPKVFNPEDFAQGPVFESPRSVASETVKIIPTKSGSKILFISLGIIAFVALAGTVVYFFVLPMIFPKENSPAVESQIVPIAQPPVETNPPLVHQSFFIASTPASASLQINLINLNLAEMNPILSTASDSIQSRTAREMALTVNGSVPEAVDFLSAAFPEMDKNFIISNFERDFTAFLYRDVNGSWPGYIFHLNTSADFIKTANFVKIIETSTNIPNLYLVNPGTSNPTGFKDGLKVGGKAIRYLSFDAPGSSFDYGWFNNYLIITTSFDGFKTALKLLGSSS